MKHKLEVGQAYRTVNGGTIVVTEKCNVSYRAKVVYDPEHSGETDYSAQGECYCVPRLDVVWPDQSAPASVRAAISDLLEHAKGEPDIDLSACIPVVARWLEPDERPLAQRVHEFGHVALQVLETDDWGAETVETIRDGACALGLGQYDSYGLFQRTPEVMPDARQYEGD